MSSLTDDLCDAAQDALFKLFAARIRANHTQGGMQTRAWERVLGHALQAVHELEDNDVPSDFFMARIKLLNDPKAPITEQVSFVQFVSPEFIKGL